MFDFLNTYSLFPSYLVLSFNVYTNHFLEYMYLQVNIEVLVQYRCLDVFIFDLILANCN